MSEQLINEAFKLYEAGRKALLRCDTAKAAGLLKSAGDTFWSAQDNKTDHVLRYNAAACYFQAGRYRDCVETLGEVSPGRIPNALKELCLEMAVAADGRHKNSYWDTVRGDLAEMRKAGRHKDIIELVRREPYILPGAELARQMRDSCKATGQDRVAALFEKDLEALQPKEQPKPSGAWFGIGSSATSTSSMPTYVTYTS